MKTIDHKSISGVVAGFLMLVTVAGFGQAAAMEPAPEASSTGPVIDTASGTIEGRSEGSLSVFKGIPYAMPPIGEARWKATRALPPWTGVREAKDFGPACPQPGVLYSTIYSNDISPFNEDCLTLNIWAPVDAKNAPVMVWIHGGALVRGSSKESLYDGTALAEQGIIVVSINYRLGVLGYLAHPELSAESPDAISGNYGLLDQLEALRWVSDNIEAFGGDPANVTVAGESAGALSVMFLLVTPDAHELFNRAIIQSGYMISLPELKETRHGTPSAEAVGADLVSKLGMTDIAAMRALDAQTLVESVAKQKYFAMGNVDGKLLKRQMMDSFDLGEQAQVPILAGFNSGEIRSLRALAPPVPDSREVYENTIHERYLDLADEFLELYPGSDMKESILATTRDALYGWTAQRLVRKQSEQGNPSFLYLFDHGYPAVDEAGLHGFHASELPFMFGSMNSTPPNWPPIPQTSDEQAFSKAMVGYWSSFVKSGKPQALNEPDWPAYSLSKAYMHFEAVPKPSTNMFPGMFELHEASVCTRKASDKAPWHWNTGLWSPVLAAVPGSGCR